MQAICLAHTDPRPVSLARENWQSPCKLTLSKLYRSGLNINVKSVMYCPGDLRPDVYGAFPSLSGIELTLENGHILGLVLDFPVCNHLVTLGVTDKGSLWLHTEEYPITFPSAIDASYPQLYERMQSRGNSLDPALIVDSDVATHPLTGSGFVLTTYMRRNASNTSNEPYWDLELYIGTAQCLVATARRTYNLLYDGKAGQGQSPEDIPSSSEPPSYSSLFESLRRSAMPSDLFES